MRIGEILHARLAEFQTHHKGEITADQTGNNPEDQIERTNIFVVGRKEPTREKSGLAVIAVI